MKTKTMGSRFRNFLMTCCLVAAGGVAGSLAQAEAAPLQVGYSDWPGWVAWQVALDKGWFKEAGVDVSFQWFDYSASLDALFMAVSGLVDNDFINIITEAQNVAGGDKSVVKRHFVLPDRDIIQTISWIPGTSTLTTCQREGGYATGGAVKEFDSVAKAAKAFRVIGEGFEKKGWVEL